VRRWGSTRAHCARRANHRHICPAPFAKIILFSFCANHFHSRAIPSRKRGVSRSSRTLVRDAVDVGGALTNAPARGRRSRVVLTPRRWRQVLERLTFLRDDGDNKPGHRGEHGISRKAIAQGRPDCLRFTCMLVCVFLLMHIAHETVGAARTRLSLRPHFFWGGMICKPRTHRVARTRKCVQSVASIEPTGGANARPMTGSATKQSSSSFAAPGLLRFARNDGISFLPSP